MKTACVGLGLALLLLAPGARGEPPLKVVEVYAGLPTNPFAQYIVLQLAADTTESVVGTRVTLYSARGFPGDVETRISLDRPLSHSGSQRRILLATPDAEAIFGVTADQRLPRSRCVSIGGYPLGCAPFIDRRGGEACWQDDCVSWGDYHSGTLRAGTPMLVDTGLAVGRSALRRLDLAGSALLLDPDDDTNDSAHDFVIGRGLPENNAGVRGTMRAAPRTAGDYDGDDRSDLFWRNVRSGEDLLWRSASSRNGHSLATVADPQWHVVAEGDFDGDGSADVFWRHAVTGANAIWRSGIRSRTLPVPAVTNLDWIVAGTGDFDGDGRSDLFWRNVRNGRNAIWKSANPATQQAVAPVTDLRWRLLAVCDVSWDKQSDLFWHNTATGANVAWGSADRSQGGTLATIPGAVFVATGDFNGDGRCDTLWRTLDSGRPRLSLLDGYGADDYTAAPPAGWRAAAVGDFDGDGFVDLVWRDGSSGANVLWRAGRASLPVPLSMVTDQAWTPVPPP